MSHGQNQKKNVAALLIFGKKGKKFLMAAFSFFIMTPVLSAGMAVLLLVARALKKGFACYNFCAILASPKAANDGQTDEKYLQSLVDLDFNVKIKNLKSALFSIAYR